ncbi:transcription factor ces-2-like isoform X6 [Crassostrea angulata]|uniref:transcription factor ces-2-like isoform X6 n=1 Tax=Magallana angulata TaxID=2784310 RepID=UPI0022B09A03|nr:transcription factor ces-2-like isoform X6 [Crassostrea angulata]
MADGGFCDFPPGVDSSIIAQMFHERAAAQSFEESRDKHHGLGFYQEHYTSVEEMAAQTMQAMSNQSRAAANMAGNSVATTAAAGLFDPHSQSTMNYALKPEKGLPPTPPAAAASASSPTLARALAAVQQTQKRPRSEKKPIPTEQKDTKYFERRKRNNMAAKKSRDARKAREDEIAIRASFLEKENAILRAQVGTLREEANSLKQLLLQKRSRP